MSRQPSRVQTIILKGGLNLAASILEVQPGQCTQLFNYEVNTMGRYQRILGYERFDGRPAPSQVKPLELAGAPFDTDAEEEQAVAAERESRREAIQQVPGSGPIRGIFVFEARTYAFRDDVSGQHSVMWRSTSSGWEQVTTPLLLPGGQYEFVKSNFGASASSKEVIGVDGVNRAFRFDGTTYTQIEAPMDHDTPTHCEALPSQVLLLGYRNGIFLYSSVGDPTKFSPVDGGGEIGCSDEIIRIQLQLNNSCAIFCRNRTFVLYGRSAVDFQLEPLSKTTGAIENSVQPMGDSIYLDDRGITRLDRVQAFGNFDMATISQLIEPLIRRYTNLVSASFLVKDKNQYRLCFTDSSGIILTMNGREVAGYSTFDYGIVIRSTYSGEGQDGSEVVFFGSDDGYVYQAERGFSFDGRPVPYVCRPAFFNLGSAEYKKRWRKAVVESDTVGSAHITLTPDFEYSDPNVPYHPSSEVVVVGSGGYWDEASWDGARWSAATTFTADLYLDGISRNITLVVSGIAEHEPPHSINSYMFHYSPRSRRR